MKFVTKLVITILLFVLIFRNIDFGVTFEVASEVNVGTLAMALILLICSSCTAAFRWSIIMKQIGFKKPFSFYLQSYFKGAFFNQGLPTSIGGDGLRILDTARIAENKEDAFNGVLIDRIVGLGGLLLLNMSALLQNRTLLPPRVYHPLLIIIVLSLVGLVALFFLHNVKLLSRVKLLGYLNRLSQRYASIYSSINAISIQVTLSVLTHLFAMSAFFILGHGVGLMYPLQTYLALVPPVILLTILPISLAGWGIREGAMVGFFVLIGADKASVLSLSILYGLLALAASLPGLFVFLTQRQRI